MSVKDGEVMIRLECGPTCTGVEEEQINPLGKAES